MDRKKTNKKNNKDKEEIQSDSDANVNDNLNKHDGSSSAGTANTARRDKRYKVQEFDENYIPLSDLVIK